MGKQLAVIGIGLLAAACSGAPTAAVSGSSGGWGGSGGTGGTTGTVDPGCGTVSEQGLCNGTQAEDCYEGDLADGGTAIIAQDCSMTVSGGPELSCGVVSGDYLDFGVACLAASSNPCAFEDATGDLILVPCAGDAGLGCVLLDSSAGSSCETGFPPCTYFDDGGLPAPSCFNNLLEVNCVYNQPTAVDCSSFGGSCSNGKCIDLPVGRSCDSLLTCATGLQCQALDGGGGSACSP